MKTCDEMVNSLLRRREQFLAEQKQKRRTAAKMTAAGGSCALAAAVGVLVLNSGMLREKKTIVPDELSAISDNSSTVNDEPQSPTIVDDSSIIWGISSSVTSHDDKLMVQKKCNGKNIDYSLHYAFEEYDDNCTFAVSATHICYDDNCSFTKTLEQFLAEDYARTEKIRCMELLTKMGDELKYGEALYLTGTPDGVKWAKEYYDSTVAEMGEELLSKYIVDGEFLKDELIRDLDTEYAERDKAMDAYGKAYAEHRADMCTTLRKELEEKGIYCEQRSPAALILYISETDLTELTLEDPKNWVFGLAYKESEDAIAGDLIVDEDGGYRTVSSISSDT